METTFRLRHLLAALSLHLMLAALLVTGLQCSPKVTRPPIISAVLLDPSRQQATQQKRDDEQRRQEQIRQERARQEQQRQDEQQRQKQLAEQKQAEALAQKKAAEDAQRKKLADQQLKQKQAAEQKKAADLAKKKQAKEEAHERQEAAQRELQEKARMEQEMRQETAQMNAQRQKDAQAASEREQKQAVWAKTLSDRIGRYWNRPASAPDDLKCTVHVQLLPDGSVSPGGVRVATTCGSDLLNRSVEDAVYRASPMPKPADPSVFDRDLIVDFCPNCQ